MLIDFCSRTGEHQTPEQIKIIMDLNYSIVTPDGFAIYNIVLNEIHCLFCYVRPGVKGLFKNLVTAIELTGKMNGCVKAKFITRRDKAFLRALPDYKPCAIMFEKGLV